MSTEKFNDVPLEPDSDGQPCDHLYRCSDPRKDQCIYCGQAKALEPDSEGTP